MPDNKPNGWHRLLGRLLHGMLDYSTTTEDMWCTDVNLLMLATALGLQSYRCIAQLPPHWRPPRRVTNQQHGLQQTKSQLQPAAYLRNHLVGPHRGSRRHQLRRQSASVAVLWRNTGWNTWQFRFDRPDEKAGEWQADAGATDAGRDCGRQRCVATSCNFDRGTDYVRRRDVSEPNLICHRYRRCVWRQADHNPSSHRRLSLRDWRRHAGSRSTSNAADARRNKWINSLPGYC